LDKIKVLVVGFGRMGISHALQTLGNCRSESVDIQLYVCDKLFISKAIAWFTCRDVKFISLSRLGKVADNYFDYAIDSTPPLLRTTIVPLLERISKKLLVEKPVIVDLNKTSMSGYVLQHNPLVDLLHKYCQNTKFVRVEVQTNLDFSGDGWRGGKYGGVVNEYLGHALSIPMSIFPKQSSVNVTSVKVSSGNITVCLSFTSVDVEVCLEYGCPDIRKASYMWRFFESIANEDSDTHIAFDLYRIRSVGLSEDCLLEGLATSGVSVPFYLRGFGFALQNKAFLHGEGDVIDNLALSLIEQCVREVAEVEYEYRTR
jgi:hypothetical protein